jgi:hypothetical protein
VEVPAEHVEDEVDGVVHIALDESFNPLICVGAAVADTEFASVNTEINQLYGELTNYSWMADLRSFKKFVEQGFHMSSDNQMIADRFLAFLAHALGFKTFIFFSESATGSKNRITLLLYRELLRTLLQKYRSRPLIKLYFEQNQELNLYFEKVVAHCLRATRRPKPQVEVLIRPKKDPPLLAVCDYTMLTFARWYAGYAGCPPKSTSPQQFTWRNFNALRRSISVVRSLETGTLVRRDLPFSDLL